jgi:antitoxin component YwqK of YwqJK toxin-antitoxin module
MEMEACYKNNLRDSTWKYYDEKGQLRYTLKYDKGILTTPEILDSIQKIQFDELERNKGRIIDPEKFMADPEQYILKGRN